MSFNLSYCPNGELILDRLRQFYQKRSQQIVLAKMNTPSRALADFAAKHKAGFCSYPDIHQRIEFWDAYTKEHINIHDDSIPTAYLSEMDQGLYGGLLGGDVRFLCDTDTGWISSMVTLLEGGTCSNFAQWLPGKNISESIDPFHMTSVDYFEKWGRGPVEKIFSQFDDGVIHIHANGRHLLKAASTIKGLKAIYLGDDIGFPSAFEVLADLKAKVNDTPVVCSVSFPDFYKAIKEHRLTGGAFYDVTDVPDAHTANNCMDLVRKYKP